MITILITIYLSNVLLTRWVMINSMRKKRQYYSPILWTIPLANIICSIQVIINNSDFEQSKIYKWWIGEYKKF